jgi:hypothetical protein
MSSRSCLLYCYCLFQYCYYNRYYYQFVLFCLMLLLISLLNCYWCYILSLRICSCLRMPVSHSTLNTFLLSPFIYFGSTASELGSSVSIVSGYGRDNQAIEGWSPAEAKDFSSSLCVQTGSGVHPASCTMGTGGPFSGGKARPGRDTDHSPPSSAEVVNE